MKAISRLFWILAALMGAAMASADVIYEQPLGTTGVVHPSSWVPPDGTDSDMFAWDNFTLATTQDVAQIEWFGGYGYGARYGKANNFRISIWPSILANTEPDVVHAPLMQAIAHSNCGETAVGTVNGTAIYQYRFSLPTPFRAVAGTKYWVQIVGEQPGFPDWGLADGTGGNGSRFVFSRGAARFSFYPGDNAFRLISAAGGTVTIAAKASPTVGGTISGAGTYPSGTPVDLVAQPNPGYGFINWREGTSNVSTTATYKFTALTDRSLIAKFEPNVTGIGLLPATVVGGKSAVATVRIAAPAPGSYRIRLSEDGGALVGVPPTVLFPVGATSVTFPVVTIPTPGDMRVIITVRGGTTKKTCALLVKAPTILKIKTWPTTVVGGRTVKGTVTINGPAGSGGCAVQLASSDAGVTMNTWAVVAAGQTSATFTVTTKPVAQDATVTITGTTGAVSKACVLTVTK